jgi:2-hydroxy-6-oxonona-2,4-dienedioate hydrolase
LTREVNFSENVTVPPVDITFVPGAAGLGSFWDPIVQRLPATWAKRTVDLPGLGPVPPRADIESYGQLVDHVARAINKPTVLVGQSMGGFIALKVALRYPELVRRLVLVVAAGGVDMKRLGAHDWRPEDRAKNPARPAWAHAQTVDLSSELHRIEVPALLIWATRDVLSPLSVAERMAAKLPKARLITFDTDDHWVALRFADETAKAIEDWALDPGVPVNAGAP